MGQRGNEVDCIWMMETHIALLQRNGDVRHIEFDINGELMRLSELFAEDGDASPKDLWDFIGFICGLGETKTPCWVHQLLEMGAARCFQVDKRDMPCNKSADNASQTPRLKRARRR